MVYLQTSLSPAEHFFVCLAAAAVLMWPLPEPKLMHDAQPNASDMRDHTPHKMQR